jgi:hypothetical protein
MEVKCKAHTPTDEINVIRKNQNSSLIKLRLINIVAEKPSVELKIVRKIPVSVSS